jgi:DNA-binding NarL/FixJ family response regulator
MPIRVQLADNHAILRQILRTILENDPDLMVVAEASNGVEAVEMARQHQPDVAVMDIDMGDLNGLEATAQILIHSPRTAVLILSMHADHRYVGRAVLAGARGYLVKDAVEERLVDAIRRILEGKTFVCVQGREQPRIQPVSKD